MVGGITWLYLLGIFVNGVALGAALVATRDKSTVVKVKRCLTPVALAGMLSAALLEAPNAIRLAFAAIAIGSAIFSLIPTRSSSTPKVADPDGATG